MKLENYEKRPATEVLDLDEGEGRVSAKQTVYLVSFACIFTLAVLATVAITLMRARYRTCAVTGGGATFRRVDSNPHPLSPEEKHINSLQVNGYYNPIYKFFDEPQDQNC